MAIVVDTTHKVFAYPSIGWTRYDDEADYFNYNDKWGVVSLSSAHNGRLHVGSVGAECSFMFKGTKLRLISFIYPDKHSNNKIVVDDVEYTFSQNGSSTYKVCVFEISGLEDSLHKVKIISGNSHSNFDIDAVDLDDNARLFLPNQTRSFIADEGGYKNFKDGVWNTISNVLPSEEQFINEGMNDISILDKKNVEDVLELNQLIPIEQGKLFTKTIDLNKLNLISVKIK